MNKLIKLNKSKPKFYLNNLCFNNEVIDLEFKNININNDLSDEAEYILEIRNRNNSKIREVKLDLHIHNNTIILRTKINILELISFINKDILDFYIKNKEIYRIDSSFYNHRENDLYYMKETNEKLLFYTTKKGNLSMKRDSVEEYAKIEKINLDKRGYLLLEGYTLSYGLDIKNIEYTKKDILISLKTNEGIEKIMPIKKNTRKDILHKYSNLSNAMDCIGFVAKVNLFEEDLKDIYNKIADIKICILYEDKMITLNTKVEDLDYKKSMYMTNLENFMKVDLNLNNNEQLQISINNRNEEVEIETIYINNHYVSIKGNIPQYHKGSIKDINIIIRNRKTKHESILECCNSLNIFSFDIDIDKFIMENKLAKGIYDIFLKIDGIEYRLVNKKDGILNKQKIVNIPQIITSDKENKAISIKMYYTLNEEVSMLVKDYASIKRIDKVKLSEEDILIDGLINIQTPNENINQFVDGKIRMNMTYGKIVTLPVKWELIYTGNTRLEFKFMMKILNQSYEKENISKEDIIENINFDLIECEINIEDIDIRFFMNVDKSKVQIKPERRFIIDDNIKLYKLYNKILPIDNNMAIFQSFHGKSYSCNPRAIYEELLRINKDIKCIWVLNDVNKKIPGNAIIVKPKSREYYYYMARSKYFINNGNFPDFYEKRKGTIHLQTWHGTPLKKLGFDISENSPAYKENTSPELIKRNKRWDYLIAPNEYTGEILKRAFRFENNLLKTGYPRNDILYRDNKELVESIKKKLNILPNKKVILYAPTWRDYEFHSRNKDNPYEFKFNLERFKNNFSNDYVILLRLHYRDASRMNISGYEDIVYNVSTYDDIQELYLISDILITDYSSVMFDYANLNRPILFYTYDLKRYGSEVRGFYFDFIKEAPGPIILKEDRLFECIQNIDTIRNNYRNRYEKFREKFCDLEDGYASKRVIDAVFKKSKKENKL